MNVVRPILLALLVVFSSSAARADDDFTRFLVPVVAQNIPGAFGSSWTADTWFHYAGTSEGFMTPTPFCFGIQCTDTWPLQPGLAPGRFERTYPGELAVLVHVDRLHAADVQFVSRIRDVSRGARWAGTAVPVIREDAMATGPLRLLNVPIDPLFRNTLRIYALPDLLEGEVEVRYYRLPVFGGTGVDLSVVLLHTQRVRLADSPGNAIPRLVGAPVLFPLIGQVANLQDFPELAAAGAIWIEIVPLTPGLRFWAMVSITNNETQQVTLVTP